MLLPVFQDLIKPQWRKVIEVLKQSGGLPVSDLARQTGTSYMAAKTHCEDLRKLGYLVRTRLPRTEVGRPEIIYHLAAKAEEVFPQMGAAFTLELLEDVRRMFGESAPEKLLFQHFQRQQEEWGTVLGKVEGLEKKVAKLVKLRVASGCVAAMGKGDEEELSWVEAHHPLHVLFVAYPRVATMELRMMEELLGCRVSRREEESAKGAEPRVVFGV